MQTQLVGSWARILWRSRTVENILAPSGREISQLSLLYFDKALPLWLQHWQLWSSTLYSDHGSTGLWKHGAVQLPLDSIWGTAVVRVFLHSWGSCLALYLPGTFWRMEHVFSFDYVCPLQKHLYRCWNPPTNLQEGSNFTFRPMAAMFHTF